MNKDIPLIEGQEVKHKDGSVFKVKKDFGAVVSLYIKPKKHKGLSIYIDIQIVAKSNLELYL